VQNNLIETRKKVKKTQIQFATSYFCDFELSGFPCYGQKIQGNVVMVEKCGTLKETL